MRFLQHFAKKVFIIKKQIWPCKADNINYLDRYLVRCLDLSRCLQAHRAFWFVSCSRSWLLQVHPFSFRGLKVKHNQRILGKILKTKIIIHYWSVKITTVSFSPKMRDFFKFPGLTPSLLYILRLQYLHVEKNLVGSCGEEGHAMPATLSFRGSLPWLNKMGKWGGTGPVSLFRQCKWKGFKT